MPEWVKSALKVVTLFAWLAQSKRATRAWARRWRQELQANCFETRSSVKHRETYANIGQETVIQELLSCKAAKAEGFQLWVSGPGGIGKSTFAFELARRAFLHDLFIPVVIDFDWQESISDHVASILSIRRANERPTTAMVDRLLELGTIG